MSDTTVVENAQQQVTKAAPPHNPLIDYKDYKFSFRKDKFGNVRSAVEVKLPVPSVEGIAEIFNNGGKGLDYLVSLVHDSIAAHVRNILNDDNDEKITSANFPYEQATWEAMVNTPEAERRGRGIPKEIWEAFAEDYIAQMPAVTGKSVDVVSLAAKHLLNKFQAVKTDKPVLRKLKDYLAVYINQTPNAEQFVECVKFLDEKADTLLAADDSALLDNL